MTATRILVLNSGSSSVKYQLLDMRDDTRLAVGLVERIGEETSRLKHTPLTGGGESGGESREQNRPIADHDEALKAVAEELSRDGLGLDSPELAAIGHRVVHGGEKFTCSVLIDDAVLDAIKEVQHLAPLHNPPNISGIEAAKSVLPDVPHIAIFDTAFHQTMPKYAYTYPVPLEWYEKHGVRRYGFHGTSHLYVSKRAAVLLDKEPKDCNIITMHIGNGVSHCAIKGGVSVDTSMGLTPLEGAVMETRSGDIDPGIPTFIMQVENLSARELECILNQKSGVLGITGGAMTEMACEPPLMEQDEWIFAFLASQPLVRLDGIPVGTGKPGPVTRRIMGAYDGLVAMECGA